MADEDKDDSEKTEEPSQYRLEEFRKRGEVASSKELVSVLILTGTIVVFILSSLYVFEVLADLIQYILTLDISKVYAIEPLKQLMMKAVWAGLKCVAPVWIASILLGILGQIMQVGFLYAPEVIQLKFDRINPINGFQRIFTPKSLMEAVKGIFKFAIIMAITFAILKDHMSDMGGFLHTDLFQGLMYGKGIFLKLGLSILLGLGVLALGDYAWVKYNYMKKLRMTKEEAKQEMKEREGSPEIRQRIRAVQRQIAQRRMMDDVKKADVVITNPTHLSIAIRYDAKNMIAPEVVAKGADFLAMRIREVAKESNIPMVENVPLARTLYKTVKVGQGVPRTLYKAVAEILAFVYKLKKKRRALDVHPQ